MSDLNELLKSMAGIDKRPSSEPPVRQPLRQQMQFLQTDAQARMWVGSIAMLKPNARYLIQSESRFGGVPLRVIEKLTPEQGQALCKRPDVNTICLYLDSVNDLVTIPLPSWALMEFDLESAQRDQDEWFDSRDDAAPTVSLDRVGSARRSLSLLYGLDLNEDQLNTILKFSDFLATMEADSAGTVPGN